MSLDRKKPKYKNVCQEGFFDKFRLQAMTGKD